ncbi:Squalene epoxidase [Elasticomyces elasticus]|uniref:Squalene monooxygenase n=1 Tax=Exophiala sideris TaxID=1016849 RepID=A0ABR0JM27_9EURO|nr:Squalene epoxidase [Elasticomyces elasticus]KAK5036625.1 Squalene epoxidase [Exophiala sideris]KAK5041544.1 Squalene epoxidase [Exophiala sideris]KAK5067008.1 Squalene epoxidase [Exophiala sideris]KAK5185067.1 Squalene epoxidase [Eurotiomycetes sp. CCFEE 6388]
MPLILDSSSESSVDAEPDIQEERRRLYHESDVVIVGAGVLGSALAVTLANQGRSVILLEKSLKEPDRIVGELLQPGGVQALTKLGLRHTLDDIDAIPVTGYTVIYYDEQVPIPYPAIIASGTQQEPDNSEKVKTPEGRSFHHGRFVSKLRAAAMAHPNITIFETEVTSIIDCVSEQPTQVLGVECLTRKTQKDCFFGSLTIVCDGYASKFRKSYIHHTPKVKSKFWGMELIDCPLPTPQHGTVVLGDNSPVLLYQIGTHETRVLVDVPEGLATTSVANGGVKGHLQNVVLPSLPAKVQPSFQAALEKGSLRSMPNSFLPPTTNKTAGLAILGDALNMRHPLTGGGMTVALSDVVLISELLSPENVPDLYNTDLVLKQMKSFHWRRKNLTSIVNILAQALYSLFAADEWQLKYLQKGCFRYFQLGGQCVDVPVGLLGGLIAQPFVLFYHFFSVALFSIWILVWENGLLMFPVSIVQAVLVFGKACEVIFPYIFAELRS